MTQPFSHGEKVYFKTGEVYFEGSFLGMVQDIDGKWLGVMHSYCHRYFMGTLRSFSKDKQD